MYLNTCSVSLRFIYTWYYTHDARILMQNITPYDFSAIHIIYTYFFLLKYIRDSFLTRSGNILFRNICNFMSKVLTIFIGALFERGYPERISTAGFCHFVHLFYIYRVHSHRFLVRFLLLLCQNFFLSIRKLEHLLKNTCCFLRNLLDCLDLFQISF